MEPSCLTMNFWLLFSHELSSSSFGIMQLSVGSPASIKIAQSGPSCRNCSWVFYIHGALYRHNSVSKDCKVGKTLYFCDIVTLNGNLNVSLFPPCFENSMCLYSSFSVMSIQIYSQSVWESDSLDVALRICLFVILVWVGMVAKWLLRPIDIN